MTLFSRPAVAAGLVAGALVVSCTDSNQARLEVAQEKAGRQIDSLLGTLDVKKKEIDLSLRSAREAVQGVRKARIKAQVRADQFDEQAQPYRDKVGRADASLKKLRDWLSAGEPVDIAGKTYPPAELKAMAGQVIQARKQDAERAAGCERSRDELRKVAAGLEKTEREYEARVARLEGKVARLDAELTAAKALKDASAGAGGDATLAESLARLEAKVADLSADARTELAAQGEAWDAAAADRQIGSAEAFVAATQPATDTVAEIDRLLGKAK